MRSVEYDLKQENSDVPGRAPERGLALAAILGMGILGKFIHRNDTTDVLELLAMQHKEVDLLIEKIEKGEGNRRELFRELANNLAAHATVEEKLFYPAVMAKQTSELLHESVEEHLSIKRVLADMIQMRLDDETFMAKLSVLKEHVSHHAHEEEEGKLFPEVKKLFDEDERAGLGNDLLAMFEELMKQQPLDNVPNEIDAAAPLPAL